MRHRQASIPWASRLLRLALVICAALTGLGGSAWAAESGSEGGLGAGDRLAASVLKHAGIHVGVAALPFVGDGAMAAALAVAGHGMVYALAPDQATLAAARVPAQQRQVLNWQVMLAQGSPKRMSLADGEADLLLVVGASAAQLAALPPSEARRVTAPSRGLVLINTPLTGIPSADLSAWAQDLGGSADLTEDGQGRWLRVRMPPAPGGEDWSHYNHGPDGNPVSQDTAISAASNLGVQWMGGPNLAGKFDTHVAAGGRIFSAEATIYWTQGHPWILRARAIANGETLWTRPLPTDFGDIGSLLVATPDAVYCKDNADVVELDAETGVERGRVKGADQSLQVVWMLLSDGVLVTASGPKRDPKRRWHTDLPHQQVQDIENADFFATSLVACDAASGRELWSFHPQRLDPAKLAISDGRLFIYTDLAYAAAFDLRSGAQLWKTPDPIPPPLNPGMNLGRQLNLILTPRQCAMATTEVYLINSLAHRQNVCFSAKDGHVLWKHMDGKPGNDDKLTEKMCNEFHLLDDPIIHQDKIEQLGPCDIDLLTGAYLKTGAATYFMHGCGHFTSNAAGLLFGQWGSVYDPSSKRYLVPEYTKAACAVGQFVADGALIKVAADCQNCMEWHGFIVLHPEQERQKSTRARLERGPAAHVTPFPCDARDWPTYRARADRRASCLASVGAHAAIRWTWTPPTDPHRACGVGDDWQFDGDLRPIPPVAVGDRVWTGSADGTLVCLNRITGQEVWRYATDGRITAAVTVADGRVYVGSGDGWIHCLAATSGRLTWRFRVPPDERVIAANEHLSSAWPILANVLVAEGTAYAVASLIDQVDGTVMCALDAATGQLRWERTYDHPQGVGGAVPGSGQLAYADGNLWWHAGEYGLAHIDARTGNLIEHMLNGVWYEPFSHGQDVGVIPGGSLVFGGRQFFLPANTTQQGNNDCIFIPDCAKNGARQALTLDAFHHSDLLPAWDDEALLGYMGMRYFSAVLSLSTGFGQALRDLGRKLPTDQGQRIPVKDQAIGKTTVMLGRNANGWDANNQLRLYGALLCANAGVCLGNNNFSNAPSWCLWAVSRAENKMLWAVNLPPTTPLFGAMAMGRDGEVLVPLIDGRVVCVGDPAASAEPARKQ